MSVMLHPCIQILLSDCINMGRGCCLNVPCDAAISSITAAVCVVHCAKLAETSPVVDYSSHDLCSNIHHAQPSRPAVPLIGSPKCAVSMTTVTSWIAALYTNCACAENDTISYGRDGAPIVT